MSLVKYRKKRSFSKTPEPEGGKATGRELRFVVQKHAASHLHYDFRLEMEGVLKSWAVPKGPSLDPEVKRLAMMVEDHPYDYRTFEGIIPKGQYGGGTVIVWDEGSYEPAEVNGATGKKEKEKALLHQLHKGKLKFTLNGSKLKGAFALVKASGRGENAWLLMKLRDRHASVKDVTKKGKSVVSEMTIEEVKETSKNIYGQKPEKKTAAKKKTTTKKTAPKKKASSLEKKTVGKRAKFPSNLKPMLATLVDEPFDEKGWTYEVKWDGYRALAFLNKGKVNLLSRNGKSFNDKFYPIREELEKWKINAILDGEIIVSNDQGISDFSSLQQWRSEDDGHLRFYVFDILWNEGCSLVELPLSERRTILEDVLPSGSDSIMLSEQFNTGGKEFFRLAEKMGLEGILAKKADSDYKPGIRTREWLKIKTASRQEVVIGGYTINDGSNKPFSSLLVGVFENGKLHYTGKIGTGFSTKLQKELLKKFKPLITKKSPFTEVPDVNKPSRFRPDPPKAEATWLKPELVCEVSFREMTSDGVMRHPSFEGMREDKEPKDVIMEKETPTKKLVKKKSKPAKKSVVKAPGKKVRKTFLNPSEETQVRKVNGHEIKFTNLSKVYWPGEKITKRDMLNYYYQVAPYILTYMKDRPQSLNRYPNGIRGKSFYQKNVTGKVPDWIETFPYFSEDDAAQKNFMVCSNEASLLYMATLGCIEMNPWSSRVQSPDHPDWCVIDLDPDKNPFDKVVEAALVTRDVLNTMGVPSYPKTSGSTGIHIYIPLGAKYTYEQSKEFARVIVTMVQREIPEFTSIERATRNRKGKIYLDFLQNRPQATLATAYSVRPKPGASVSTPLFWEEVKKGLRISDFTIRNVPSRIAEIGDIFRKVVGKGIDMMKALKALG